jgi:hypothetical protein
MVSSPEFVEHELFLGGAQWRAGDGVPGAVDVLPCRALGDEDGEFAAFTTASHVGKQFRRRDGVVKKLASHTGNGILGIAMVGRCGHGLIAGEFEVMVLLPEFGEIAD